MSDVFPPKPIGPTVNLFASCMIALLELGEPRVGICIIEHPEQLLLRVQVPRRAIAADTDSDCARTAALPLRLPDGVQDALADAFERRSARPR